MAERIGELLDRWGASADDPLRRAALPAVARGTGVVLAVPPAPSYANVAIAAALNKAAESDDGLALVLVPEAMLFAFNSVVGPFSEACGRSVVIASEGVRIEALTTERAPIAIITHPAAAVHLMRRSRFATDRVRTIVLAWPELDNTGEELTAIFQEIKSDCPRVIVTSDPTGQAGLIERYGWRAPVVGPLGAPAATGRIPQLQIVETSWEGRLAALVDLVEFQEAMDVTILTADASQQDAIRAAVAAVGTRASFVAGERETPITVAFDPPPPDVLAELSDNNDYVLAPSGVVGYLSRWAERLDPLAPARQVSSLLESVAGERELIESRIKSGDLRGAILTLDPLLEYHPAAMVAAALHSLWREAVEKRPEPVPTRTASPPVDRRARVWVSAGKKDGVTLGEWLAFLTQDLHVDRSAVGRVELRETFTLLECPTPRDAEQMVAKLAGQTLKGRRLSARIDRGRDRPPPGRGSPRRPSA